MRQLHILGILLCAVITYGGTSEKGGFVIDPKRPYADIVFSRIGERSPVFPGESKQGLWLALRNNCVYAIRVRILTTPNQNPGMIVAHEVFSTVPKSATPAPAGSLMSSPAMSQPQGYTGTDVVSNREVLPSHELLFSIPLEHVTRNWAIRVEVDLEIPRPEKGIEPRTFVEFYFSGLSPGAQHLSDQMLAGALR